MAASAQLGVTSCKGSQIDDSRILPLGRRGWLRSQLSELRRVDDATTASLHLERRSARHPCALGLTVRIVGAHSRESSSRFVRPGDWHLTRQ